MQSCNGEETGTVAVREPHDRLQEILPGGVAAVGPGVAVPHGPAELPQWPSVRPPQGALPELQATRQIFSMLVPPGAPNGSPQVMA